MMGVVTAKGEQRERGTFIKAVLRLSLNEFANAIATCGGVGLMSPVPWVAWAMWRSSAASQSVPPPQALTLILAAAQRATALLSTGRFSPSFLPSVRNKIFVALVRSWPSLSTTALSA